VLSERSPSVLLLLLLLLLLSRSRSIYERALDVDHRNIALWLKYAEMEMKNRQVNHARNIWDRAITILPRVNQFWYAPVNTRPINNAMYTYYK